jgi:hypothetical protein
MPYQYIQGISNVPVRLLGTRFSNAISCFEPSPQEPYREIFLKCCVEKGCRSLHRIGEKCVFRGDFILRMAISVCSLEILLPLLVTVMCMQATAQET